MLPFSFAPSPPNVTPWKPYPPSMPISLPNQKASSFPSSCATHSSLLLSCSQAAATCLTAPSPIFASSCVQHDMPLTASLVVMLPRRHHPFLRVGLPAPSPDATSPCLVVLILLTYASREEDFASLLKCSHCFVVLILSCSCPYYPIPAFTYCCLTFCSSLFV